MLRLLQRQWAYVALLALLSGCITNPVKYANLPEQRAFALYGQFLVYEEKAAELVQKPEISEGVKDALRRADKVAKPLADSLVLVALEVEHIRKDLALGLTTEERLQIVVENLEAWYTQTKPAVDKLVAVIEEM